MRANEAPWMVYLYDSAHESSCSGSLVAPTWVVTAAHCIATRYGPVNPAALEVDLGGPTYRSTTELATRAIYMHPTYRPISDALAGDIALIELDAPTAVTPLRLPDQAFEAAALGGPLRAYGWGSVTADGNDERTLLRSAAVRLGSAGWAHARGVDDVTDAMLVGYGVGRSYRRPRGICSGDSGGPLIAPAAGVLVGVNDWGSGDLCGTPDTVDGWTRVWSFNDWLTSTMTAPFVAAAPAVTGTPAPGATVTCTGAESAYRVFWYLDGRKLRDERGPTLELLADDAGARVSCAGLHRSKTMTALSMRAADVVVTG